MWHFLFPFPTQNSFGIKSNVEPKASAQPGATATVHDLSELSSASLDTTVVVSEGKRLTLRSPIALAPFTALRVDVGGGLLLGEVVGSAPGIGGYMLTLDIDQEIPSLHDLAKLLSRV